MRIIGVGHAGCRQFDSFEELVGSPLLREFTSVLVGEDITVLPVDTDFVAYARSRERERLDALDGMCGLADDYGFREDRDGSDNDHGIRVGRVGEL